MGTLQLGKTKQLEDALNSSGQSSINQAIKGRPIDTDLAIVLENVAAGFVKPNILDVKLGSRLWDEDAPLEKRRRLDKVAEQTTSSTLGFRIAGMKTHNQDTLKVFDKFYGRALTDETVHQAFEELFDLAGDSPDKDSFSQVIQGAIEAVQDIEQVISQQCSIMYSSSLLFVYEGDREARRNAVDTLSREAEDPTDDQDDDNDDDNDDTASSLETPKLFDVRVIDFAHARWLSGPGAGPDENMLRGIRSVIRILEQMPRS